MSHDANSPDAVARALLDALAAVNRRLRDHAVALRKQDRVVEVETSVEVARYETGAELEAYVDAELSDGTAVSWILEVRWPDDSWTLDASLRRSASGGQERVTELPTETVANLDALLSTLPRTVDDLLRLEMPL